MSKHELPPTVVSFRPCDNVQDKYEDTDEIVLRVSDIDFMYVKQSECYISVRFNSHHYQMESDDYNRIKKLFLEQR